MTIWQSICQTYFWRTYDGQEVDAVEEINGRIQGYEVKWSQAKKAKTPKSWKTTYPDALLTLINKDNHLPFILNAEQEIAFIPSEPTSVSRCS